MERLRVLLGLLGEKETKINEQKEEIIDFKNQLSLITTRLTNLSEQFKRSGKTSS